MLKRIKKYFSDIAENNRVNSDLFDHSNCWVVTEIKDKNKFLSRIIEIIPDDCIWNVWGVFDEQIQTQLFKYVINGKSVKTYKLRTLLSLKNKNEIQSKIHKWNLEANFISQFIHKENEYFFTSEDNLHNYCTSVSLKINKFEMEKMKKENLIEYQKRINNEYV